MSVALPCIRFQLRFSKPALYHEGHAEVSRLFLEEIAGHRLRTVLRFRHAKFNS